MFCSNCGSQLSETARFCHNCGTPVPAEPAFTPPEPPVYEPPTFTPPAPPVYEPPTFTPPAPPVYEPPVFTAPEQPVYAPPAEPAYAPPAQPGNAPPKKKGKGILITIIAAVLALAIVGGILIAGLPSRDQKVFDQAVALYQEGNYAAALQLFESLDTEDSQRYAEWCRRRLQSTAEPMPTQAPTAAPTEATEPTPTEPAITVDLTAQDAQLVYALTDADVENFYVLLETGEALAMNSNDSGEVDALFDQVDEAYEYLETQYGIAMVLYYCDLNDTAASDLYLSCTDTVTAANDAYMQAARRIYLAETPHNSVLFEDWTEEELQMLVRYTDEIAKLEKRNAEIEVAYQNMQDSATLYDDMVPLYLEMVQNKNRIAQIYGYDNYYTYAYANVYGRDYGSEQIALMREYASIYLPGAMEGAMDQFTADMESLSYADQLTISGMLFNDYTEYEDTLAGYLASLPEGTRADMVDMFKGNILRMQNNTGAMEGAFTTNLTEDRSICFFGPDYSNVMTVVHEVGHYYGSKHADLDEIPMDLAETQSQGNEWLFISYLLSQEDSALNNALRDYKFYNDLVTIAICVIVDEFEERVYTHPNVASLTSDDLDAIMEEVCIPYGGIEFLGSIATDIQQYWRMVVVEQPVYYISYGVSAIAAMNIYTIAQEHYPTGMEIYCGIIENIDPEEGFLANITQAGLDGPFDENVYIDIARMFS